MGVMGTELGYQFGNQGYRFGNRLPDGRAIFGLFWRWTLNGHRWAQDGYRLGNQRRDGPRMRKLQERLHQRLKLAFQMWSHF